MLQEDNFDWRVLNTFIHHSKTATSDFKPSHPPTSSPKPWLSKAINHHLATGHWAQSKVTLQPPTKSWRGGSRGRETGKRKEGWRKGQKVENTEAAGRWREIVWSISSAIAVGGKSLKSTLLSSVLLRHSILSTHRMVPDTTERVISKWKFGWIETASHKKNRKYLNILPGTFRDVYRRRFMARLPASRSGVFAWLWVCTTWVPSDRGRHQQYALWPVGAVKQSAVKTTHWRGHPGSDGWNKVPFSTEEFSSLSFFILIEQTSC